MPSFEITAPSQRVALDVSGAAQVPFTVRNTTTQTLRGRLLTKTQEPARPEWLTLIGEPVRNFAPGAALQVIVRLRVPSGSPAGSYAFRLDAIAETAPTEDVAQGPTIAFAVAASKPKKRFPWWIVAAAVLIGVGVGRVLRGEAPRG